MHSPRVLLTAGTCARRWPAGSRSDRETAGRPTRCRRLADLSRRAGIDTHIVLLHHAHHTWRVWRRCFADALPWAAARLGLAGNTYAPTGPARVHLRAAIGMTSPFIELSARRRAMKAMLLERDLAPPKVALPSSRRLAATVASRTGVPDAPGAGGQTGRHRDRRDARRASPRAPGVDDRTRRGGRQRTPTRPGSRLAGLLVATTYVAAAVAITAASGRALPLGRTTAVQLAAVCTNRVAPPGSVRWRRTRASSSTTVRAAARR